MLLEYDPWLTPKVIACQVASLVSLQGKQKQETADQCIELKKQWWYLEKGLMGSRADALCTVGTVSHGDKQTWSAFVRLSAFQVCGVSAD